MSPEDLRIVIARDLLSRLKRGQRVRLSIMTQKGIISVELNDPEELLSFLTGYIV